MVVRQNLEVSSAEAPEARGKNVRRNGATSTHTKSSRGRRGRTYDDDGEGRLGALALTGLLISLRRASCGGDDDGDGNGRRVSRDWAATSRRSGQAPRRVR